MYKLRKLEELEGTKPEKKSDKLNENRYIYFNIEIIFKLIYL